MHRCVGRGTLPEGARFLDLVGVGGSPRQRTNYERNELRVRLCRSFAAELGSARGEHITNLLPTRFTDELPDDPHAGSERLTGVRQYVRSATTGCYAATSCAVLHM